MPKSVLRMKRDFNLISVAFRSGEFNLETLAKLIEQIRDAKQILSKEQAEMLLEVPIDVLESDVALRAPESFARENSEYFYGNMRHLHINDVDAKFKLARYDLDDIRSLTAHIQTDFCALRDHVEYLLRIPEVTLRDHVKLKEDSSYLKSGRVFADQIDKAMNS